MALRDFGALRVGAGKLSSTVLDQASPTFQEPNKTWNGNVQMNILTKNSEQCEGTPHENVGFETKAESSPELRHEHCHGISLPYFLRPRFS